MAFVGDQHQAWRLGGDEFAILLHDVHTETEVRRFAQRCPNSFFSHSTSTMATRQRSL